MLEGSAYACMVRSVCQLMWFSGMHQGSGLGPLRFIRYTSKFFPIVGNHIVGHADDTTVYAVISIPSSLPQGMESLNQDWAASKTWYLKWHLRLNSNKTKSQVVSRSRTRASGCVHHTLGGEVLEEVKSRRVLGVTVDSKLMFETHLR